MTNHYIDMKNSKCFLVFSNPAENHPTCMQYVNEARFNHGAKLLVVEPRRTRLASQADIYLRIRPGTDIAFFSGLLKRHYANIDADGQTAAYLPGPTAIAPGPGAYLRQLDQGGHYWHDKAIMNLLKWPKWTDALFRTNEGYPSNTVTGGPDDYLRYGRDVQAGSANANAMADPNFAAYAASPPKATLANKEQLPVLAPDLNASASGGTRTVYEVFKARVAAYDSATVADICGHDAEAFEAVADTYLNNSWAYTHSTTDATVYSAGSILYAMGTTQHSHGAANVKSCANLQITTGNIGKCGGGVNALRGVGNVQGSTDQNLLWHLYMAYVGVPSKFKVTAVTDKKNFTVKGRLWKHNKSGETASYVGTDPELCCRILLCNKNGFDNTGNSNLQTYSLIDNCGTAVTAATYNASTGTTAVTTEHDITTAGSLTAGECVCWDYETWLQAKSFGGRTVYPTVGTGTYNDRWDFSDGLAWVLGRQ